MIRDALGDDHPWHPLDLRHHADGRRLHLQPEDLALGPGQTLEYAAVLDHLRAGGDRPDMKAKRLVLGQIVGMEGPLGR